MVVQCIKYGSAAEYNIERCPKMAFQSPVTSHQSLLIPSYSSLLSNFRISPRGVLPFDNG